jgi:hypothetical protein
MGTRWSNQSSPSTSQTPTVSHSQSGQNTGDARSLTKLLSRPIASALAHRQRWPRVQAATYLAPAQIPAFSFLFTCLLICSAHVQGSPMHYFLCPKFWLCRVPFPTSLGPCFLIGPYSGTAQGTPASVALDNIQLTTPTRVHPVCQQPRPVVITSCQTAFQGSRGGWSLQTRPQPRPAKKQPCPVSADRHHGANVK